MNFACASDVNTCPVSSWVSLSFPKCVSTCTLRIYSETTKRCALCPWVRLYRDGFRIIWHRFTRTKIWEAPLSIHRLSWGGTNNLWACGFLRELDGWCFSRSDQVLAFHSGSNGCYHPHTPKGDIFIFHGSYILSIQWNSSSNLTDTPVSSLGDGGGICLCTNLWSHLLYLQTIPVIANPSEWRESLFGLQTFYLVRLTIILCIDWLPESCLMNCLFISIVSKKKNWNVLSPCVWACACHGMHVEVTRQLWEPVFSFCLVSSRKAWLHSPLPSEPSYCPLPQWSRWPFSLGLLWISWNQLTACAVGGRSVACSPQDLAFHFLYRTFPHSEVWNFKALEII